jgi:hypothetical protein
MAQKDTSDFRKLVEDISKMVGRLTTREKAQPADGQQSTAAVPVDASAFLRERESTWKQFSTDRVWAIGAITLLSIHGDAIDPLSACFREFYDSLRVFGESQ